MEKENENSEAVKEKLHYLENELEITFAAIEEQRKLQAMQDERYRSWNNPNFWNFYYAKICVVCHTMSRIETCNRCKMISYCGEKHRKSHWPEHKDLCKVILGMLNETGATTLFDNLKAYNEESWLKIKIDLMLKAESKLGKPLLNYEKEMFLFPKTCFFCHESDLSIVKSCDCGVYLCKQHKKDERHMTLCHKFHQALILAIEMNDIKPYPLIRVEAEEIIKPIESLGTIPVHTEITNLPNSMKNFLQTYMKLTGQAAREVQAHTRYRPQIVSEFISRPLTLLYAIQKLNLFSSSTLTIHVIGATHNEFVLAEYWEIILHWIPALKTLEVVYIGPELEDNYGLFISVCKSCKIKKKYIDSVGRAATYEDYFYKKFPKQAGFQKPDIVIGYNLDLHEIKLGITEWTWKDGISILKKVNAPFIMTAGSEKRANKDHEMLCKLLEKPVSYLFCEPNPFAGLIPERDFETEELKYTNKHILIYNSFYEESIEPELALTKLNQDSVENKRVITTVNESEKKVEAEGKQKSEKRACITVGELEKEIEAEEKQKSEKLACITVGELEKQIEDEEKQKSEKRACIIVNESEKQIEVEEKQKSEKLAYIRVSELEKQVEAEEKQLSEKVSQFKEKQSETIVVELKKEFESKDRKDSDVFEFKGKNHISRETLNSESETSSSAENPKLVEQDLLLKEENGLLKENNLLKEENNQLASENKKLKQENERLKAENQLIKDFRSQVKEK